MRIDIAPLTTEANEALEYVQTRFDKEDIADFLKLLLVKSNNPQSAYFDFSKCAIKKVVRPVPSKKTRKSTPTNPDQETMLAAFRKLGLEEEEDKQNHFTVKIEKFEFVEVGGGELDAAGDCCVVDDKGVIRRFDSLERRGADKPLRVGRNLDCDLLIKKDILVSRHHGKLWYVNGSWWYQDTNSTHGSIIQRSGNTVASLKKSDQSYEISVGDAIVLSASGDGMPHASIVFISDQESVPMTPLNIDSAVSQ